VFYDFSGHNIEAEAVERHILEGMDLGQYKEMDEESQTFINKTQVSQIASEPSFHLNNKPRKYIPCWLDTFRALYPSSNISSSQESNHKFLLFDLSTDKNFIDKLDTIKLCLCNKYDVKVDPSGPPTDISFSPLLLIYLCAPYLRNSWMFMHGSDTSMALAESIIKFGFYREYEYVKNSNKLTIADALTAKNAEEHRNEAYGDLRWVIQKGCVSCLSVTPTLHQPMEKIMEKMITFNQITAIGLEKISLSVLFKLTQKNRKAYLDLLALARKFDTYPAIAWPVRYNDSKDSNIGLFKTVKSKSRQQPVTTSSMLGADVSRAIIQMAAVADKYATKNL
jgi:hypothetical protein